MRTPLSAGRACEKRGKVRENTNDSGTKFWLIIVSHLIGWEGGVSVLNQSESEVKQNHLLSLITYATQLKFVLFHFNTSAALNCTLKLKTAERTLK